MGSDVRVSTEIDKHVGRVLRALRKMREMTQTDLAERVGVTFQQIQKYERGTNRISAGRLWTFCKVLDVAPSRFFDGLDQMQVEPRTERPEPVTAIA